jgi:hypothetical protein
MKELQESLRVFKVAYQKRAAVDIEDFIQDIERLVDGNHHTEAYALAAKKLGAKALAKKFELVQELQKIEGNIPSDLRKYRDSLYDVLMGEAKRLLSDDDYEEFHSAF